MNTLDAKVTQILKPPYESYNRWWVDVMYDCWGSEEKTSLMFSTKEEADKVEVGYEVLV